jgi:hypothetical protein
MVSRSTLLTTMSVSNGLSNHFLSCIDRYLGRFKVHDEIVLPLERGFLVFLSTLISAIPVDGY